jgi:3-oxoacyl-[acyl-carrier protein] reductase
VRKTAESRFGCADGNQTSAQRVHLTEKCHGGRSFILRGSMPDMGNRRKALVTGSSRGIGAAIAKRLSSDGIEIVVHGNQNPAAAETVVEEIKNLGGKATFVLGDLSQPDSIKTMLDSLEDRAQELNILINNAGIFWGASLDALTLDDIHRVFSVNVISLVLITQEFLRRKTSEGGRIINISSFAAQAPGMNVSLYAASKAAVDALTRCWSLELGSSGITVNSVAPGYVETDMSAQGIGDPAPVVRGVSLKRAGLPGDIADVVAFLASDASRWITGQVINANGGQLASATLLRSL